jgi:hypothetical protein
MAELKIISANGMREVIADTRADYEAASGQTLAVRCTPLTPPVLGR